MIRPWNRQSATRLATEVTFHAHHEHFVLKNTTFRAPAIIPNFTEYCACHEKWHLNFTKYCACHEKRISWLILVTHETLFTMRGATSVIVQTHQILRLPRKMNLMIDPWHKWNVKYNARSNMRHSPNSPNTAPATKNERPESQRNSLKTDETSFPMRGRSENDPTMIRAWSDHDPTMKPSVRNPPRNRGYLSRPPRAFCIEKYNISRSGYHSKFHRILRLPRKVTLELHQILRLPRKKNLMIDPCHTWNAILYNARSNKCHCPNSRQILRLPRKMNLMIDPWHKWNVIYNARSNMRHSPNSPSTAPATKNDRPESQRNSLKTDETSFPMRGRSENDPTMIRAWSEHDPTMIRPWNRQSATRLATEVTFHAHHEHFVLKNTTFRAPAIIPNFTEYCACHEKWHLNFTKYCACHEKWHLHFTKYCACHEKWHFNFTKYCACLSCDLTELWLDWAVTWLAVTWVTELWLDWAVTWLSDLTERLDWAITWLSCDLTELWRDWAVTWLSCDLTELWLDWAVTWLSCDWAVTWLSCDLTELWLDWAVTWLSCDVTELWRDWAVTWLSCDLTELWLDWAVTELWRDWAVTWLSCDVTELWLDWTVTWLSCNLTGCDLSDWAVTWLSCDVTERLDWATWLSYYLTELWLDWAVTWLSCDVTELWLDWAVTWLSCDLTELWLSCDVTELWLDWAVTWLSCDLTELWLDWAVTWLSWDAMSFVYRKFLNLNFLRLGESSGVPR